MKILVDVQGCDHPEKMIAGCVNAAKAHGDYTIVIVGNGEFINSKIDNTVKNIEVVDAPDVITNDDVPTRAIRQKPDSSLVRALTMLKQSDEAIGLVSAGSTGALLTGAVLLVGRLNKDVHRPVMASLMPTLVDGKLVCIADCGANVDSTPEFLAQFGMMASVYMKVAFGIESPKVALLSVGTEDKKGDERTRATHALLKELPINFVGNMEARDALSGEFDVIVCDGFAGNVLVKSTEGTAKMVMKKLKDAIYSSLASKIGALFMKKALHNLKDAMDYHKYGGAPFLGISKLVIKTHGSSNDVSTLASIERIISLNEKNVLAEMEKGIAATIAKEKSATEDSAQ